MKETVCTIVGLIGSVICAVFGGWNSSIATLLILMSIDYMTGMIVAGVFHRSQKSNSGALESHAGWKGLCRKGVTMLVVAAGCRIDVILGTSCVRDGVVIAYIANETISIIENAGLMGVPIPKVITESIGILKNKSEQ